jgi:spore germination protein YaaH
MKRIIYIGCIVMALVGMGAAWDSGGSWYLPVVRNRAVALGYYTGTQESYAAVQAFAGYINAVSSDVFAVQMDGSIAGGDDFDVLAFDQAHGIETYACVSNYNNAPGVEDFDAALAHAAIVTHKEAVIANLVALGKNGGYTGINIDFENLAYSANIETDRAAFTSFIHDLALALHGQGLKLVISVPGKTADEPADTWGYPFDLAALGREADFIQLMTYDQHGPWGEPGPVAGADWVDQCLSYATSQMAAWKLLIGLPAYGYDWDRTAGMASSFAWTDVPSLLGRQGAKQYWDAGSSSPYLTYMKNGRQHVAWYENAESIRIKAALVMQYGLAGVSMWSLGQEDANFWEATR